MNTVSPAGEATPRTPSLSEPNQRASLGPAGPGSGREPLTMEEHTLVSSGQQQRRELERSVSLLLIHNPVNQKKSLPLSPRESGKWGDLPRGELGGESTQSCNSAGVGHVQHEDI